SKAKLYNLLKNSVLWIVVTIVLGSAFSAAIIVRHETAPIYNVNDIIIQQEAAIHFFVHGKNPYSETYFHTPLAQWHYSDTEVNPALYHFVMEPFYFLFSIPFYIASNHTIGYFDGRIPLLFLFAVMLLVAFFVPKGQENKRLFVTLLAFSPATLGYALEGRSDIYMFAFSMLGFFLLSKKYYFWAGIPMALAFMIKQSIWPFFPLYVAYLLFVLWQEHKTFKKAALETIKNLVGFSILVLVIAVPFYLWNPKAFLESTIYYLSGNDPHSYPISGYGLGAMLNQFGVIKNVHAYYPFTYWQVGIGVPVLAVLIWSLYKKPTVTKLIFSYGIFLFVFWYLARYFNNSHLGYLSMVFITAYFWRDEKEKLV
ncbi:MAG TPA: hypothetical protein VN711_04285, partial [Candidatus Saccharimonadales bacterium]|nr:hypothetical protein [Candidatus Saccharimonadales bacterium]